MDRKIKRMKSTMPQHCISVMRAERLKLSLFASNEICDGRTVNAPKSRTTLILGRWATYTETIWVKRFKMCH